MGVDHLKTQQHAPTLAERRRNKVELDFSTYLMRGEPASTRPTVMGCRHKLGQRCGNSHILTAETNICIFIGVIAHRR